jgi:DNA-directed RNA polymerase specialized sigma24 family protein
MTAENRGPATLSPEQVMAGILAMLVAEREDRLASLDGKGKFEPKKTELILSEAGLSAQQIAGFLGKKPNTVLKTLSRARARGDSDGTGAADD